MLTRAKNAKQPKCPWVNGYPKCVCVYNEMSESYSALKRKEIPTPARFYVYEVPKVATFRNRK